MRSGTSLWGILKLYQADLLDSYMLEEFKNRKLKNKQKTRQTLGKIFKEGLRKEKDRPS